jgi:uroporphyrinogen-III synthase
VSAPRPAEAAGAGVGLPTLVVTRPIVQAEAWARRLGEQGVDTRVLPLLEIVPAGDAALVHQAWRSVAGSALVVFVSPNAAACFFDLRPEDVAWPPHTLAGSTGPGTRDALLRAGVPPDRVVSPAEEPGTEPRFDSEGLWERLSASPWNGHHVLIVRGDGGRDWLADTLREHGADVSFVQAYQRRAPRWTAAQRAVMTECTAQPERYVWWLSSSEAVDHLVKGAPQLPWPRAQALASHARIEQRAHEAGFGRVARCPPVLQDVLAALRAWPRA